MTSADFAAWRKRLRLSQAAAASTLGCGRRSVQNWESGASRVPYYIALACAAVALGVTPPHDWNDK